MRACRQLLPLCHLAQGLIFMLESWMCLMLLCCQLLMRSSNSQHIGQATVASLHELLPPLNKAQLLALHNSEQQQVRDIHALLLIYCSRSAQYACAQEAQPQHRSPRAVLLLRQHLLPRQLLSHHK